MLPFLKLKKETSFEDGAPAETIEREHDEHFDMLDAIAEDMIHAFSNKSKEALKEALEAFVSHIQEMDEEQDEQGESK